MLDISTVVFFLLSISVLFIYRMTRAGYKSLLFFNNDLDVDKRYNTAEKIRVVQVCLGFGFFIYHSIIFFGLNNTVIFFFSSFMISLLLEIIGTNKGLIFGKYTYEPSLCPGPMIKNVPILIAISWTGLIYMALVCAMMLIDGSAVSTIRVSHILLSALLVTILDLVLDPIAVDEGRWSWEMPGKYYGVPIKNFIGWFFNCSLILFLFSMISSSHVITNSYVKYIEFAPGILFVILPAIAARPCFERNLNIAGIIGLLFTIILVTMSYHNII